MRDPCHHLWPCNGGEGGMGGNLEWMCSYTMNKCSCLVCVLCVVGWGGSVINRQHAAGAMVPTEDYNPKATPNKPQETGSGMQPQTARMRLKVAARNAECQQDKSHLGVFTFYIAVFCCWPSCSFSNIYIHIFILAVCHCVTAASNVPTFQPLHHTRTNMEGVFVEWQLKDKPRYPEQNSLQCRFVHHK